MHSLVPRSALPNSLSDFNEVPVSESKQAFAFANYYNEREQREEVNVNL
jgi:hypothetical protein